MFTGIVEEQGIVEALIKARNLYTLILRAQKVAKSVKPGDSVAINGVCLTLTKLKGAAMFFDIMKETIAVTTLGRLKSGEKVNLELALKVDSRFGGHFVTGHIDGIGTIRQVIKQKNYVEFRIFVPAALRRYIVPKGSIGIDGVSLTVGAVGKNGFSVYLIPFTLHVTIFADKKIGDKVNVETDILARYALNN